MGIGVAYLVFVLCTGLRIPCPLFELTGLKCPGCGVTRMIVSLARLDFFTAFLYNPFLFVTGPLVIGAVIYTETRYVLYESKMSRWVEIFFYVELVLALAYGVLRNL